jgi:hypothetical protein
MVEVFGFSFARSKEEAEEEAAGSLDFPRWTTGGGGDADE